MVKSLNDYTYEDELSKNRLSVVKVYATWCGPCKLLKPHFNKWSDNFGVYNDTDIKYYEINNDENKKFIKKYEISHLPSIMFFVYGVHVFTIKGMTRSSVFEKILGLSFGVDFEIKED